jgi:hypothetical protein
MAANVRSAAIGPYVEANEVLAQFLSGPTKEPANKATKM